MLFPGLCLLFASCRHGTLFQEIESSHSGVHFINEIKETDSMNVLDISNIYNGGGVGVGDFNRDGRPDIYFTGNAVANRLYLNRGDFSFDDITDASGTAGGNRWSRGVAVVDVNHDGWPDIYVCTTILADKSRRKNLLYINQGNDAKGIPHFIDKAAEYGLADTSFSTMAAFFDMDNDGDLDMYLVVNEIVNATLPNVFHKLSRDGSFPSSGRLYRNDWSDSLKHPVFTDVSNTAGVAIEGYGHSVNVCDINQDGWKDLYVTNDYLPNDLMLINNHDGTFTDHLSDCFKHTSSNSMGVDVNDINNDGLVDIFTLDMNPEDNLRKKMMLNPGSYRTYQNSDAFGYTYQYVRNTLQLNQGNPPKTSDSSKLPVFSDIAFSAGVAETDWSWTPLITDFDNDGFRDILVTNGFPKDVTDHDFISFRNKSSQLVSKSELLKQIPEVKLHKYGYRNDGDLHFSDVSEKWGLMKKTFSNGAVYVDLDGDGDLDLVMNNINDEAGIYRNESREQDAAGHHYLRLRLAGDSLNPEGLGAWIELHYAGGQKQVYENTPYRGYLSTNENIAHFGLGKVTVVDSLLIKWPDGKKQWLLQVPADQVLTVKAADAKPGGADHQPETAKPLFAELPPSVTQGFRHTETDYIDFNIQKLLPHKLSDYGPGLAVADMNGDGLDDFVCGGSAGHPASLFFQDKSGNFHREPLFVSDTLVKRSQDTGLLLFDADGDGDADLYVASGGYENEPGSEAYQDRFYLNDGAGRFTLSDYTLPANHTSKFCVRAADFDRDGDLDLFVSGRVDPHNYPRPVSSFIFRNDSKNGKIQFTDVTAEIAPDLVKGGMICDAAWTDFDNDGWPDLVLAGEWMPVTLLKNTRGRFGNVTEAAGIAGKTGWWNSIVAGDFDNDGDMDYVVGNLGTNSYFRAAQGQPVRIYAKDFDKNGIYDVIPSLYLPDEQGRPKEFPAQGREDLLRQITAMRKKFATNRLFATAGMDVVLGAEERKDALVLEAGELRSVLLRNKGNGQFSMEPLPPAAQFSTLNAMMAEDINGDGNLDLLLNGNDYGTDVSVGRYDAFNGLFLAGDGKGNFNPMPMAVSGFYVPGNAKALVGLRGATGRLMIAASRNRDALKVFDAGDHSVIAFRPGQYQMRLHWKDGRQRLQEGYYGSSYLSQSGRFFLSGLAPSSVEVRNAKNEWEKR